MPSRLHLSEPRSPGARPRRTDSARRRRRDAIRPFTVIHRPETVKKILLTTFLSAAAVVAAAQIRNGHVCKFPERDAFYTRSELRLPDIAGNPCGSGLRNHPQKAIPMRQTSSTNAEWPVCPIPTSTSRSPIVDRYGVGRGLRPMMLKNCFTGRDRRLEIVWQQYSFPLDCAALGPCESPVLRFIGCKPFARIIRDPHERQHYGDFDQHADDRGHRRAGP